jgi:hypothetical protein
MEWRQGMAKRRKSYQKRSPDQWNQLVWDQRLSGQSVRVFARSRGICESSLGRWSRLLPREDEPDLGEATPIPSGHENHGDGLVELVAKHEHLVVNSSSDEVRLLVGAGVCLELSQLPAPEYLALVARSYDAMAS